ncbi:MAG: flagellar export protein FliJ [Desulfobulbaceae bacterium]|nr:MAG: flagellar export protein FliJ [Desulfobulbaceae bacterium]
MKPFSLHAVLRYRERLRDIARTKFQDAQNEHARVLKNRSVKQQEQTILIETLEFKQAEGIEIKDHILFENRIALLQEEIIQLDRELKRKQEVLVRERNYLLEKSKEKRAMERLKEKQDDAWNKHLDKKESAMLDEIAVLYRNR